DFSEMLEIKHKHPSSKKMFLFRKETKCTETTRETEDFEQLKKLRNRFTYIARSCKEIKDRYGEYEGEDNTITQITSHNYLTGNWSNRNTFGTVESATADDFKVKSAVVVKTQYPVRYKVGTCSDRGPAIPIIYDHGDAESTKKLYGPNPRREFEPGFITFRAINWESAAMAICSGVKPTVGCNTEHYCIGGGGYFNPEEQCGDFPSFDYDRLGKEQGWSASKEMTEAAVLLFYR
uniref:Uncharacterized protein n=1 Tax=Pundamilia nyererei TaxID=303518 RepID=A0A3B4HAF0_9CICH